MIDAVSIILFVVSRMVTLQSFDEKKKNPEILAALIYKQIYNINRSEKWSKTCTNRGL